MSLGLVAGTALLKIVPDLTELGDPLTAGIKNKVSSIGSTLTRTLTPAAAGAAAAFGAMAHSYHEGADSIRTQTGLTGDKLEELVDIARSVAGKVTQPFSEVGEVLGTLAAKTDLPHDKLRDLTKQVLEFSRVTGTDASTNAVLFAEAINKWKIPADQAATTMDRLFRISQATGTPMATLLETVTKFAGPLQSFGFGLDTSAAMVGILTQRGANADKVFTAMQLGLSKMAKGLKEDVPPAFKGAGDAWTAARAALQTGDTETAFRTLGDAIRGAGTDLEAKATAIEVFGSRAGPALASALRGGADGVDHLVDRVRKGGDTIHKASEETLHFGDRLTMLKNRAVAVIGPVAQQAATAATIVAGIGPSLELFGKIGPQLGRIAGPVASAISNLASLTAATVASAAAQIASWIATAAAAVVNAAIIAASWLIAAAPFVLIGLAVAALVFLIVKHWTTIKDFLLAVWNGIKSVALTVWNAILAFFKKWGPWVLAALTGPIGLLVLFLIRNWDKVKAVTSAVWNAIRNFLVGIWNGIRGTASAVWNAITSVISGAVNRARSIISGVASFMRGVLGGAFNAIRGFASGAWNAVVGAFQGAYNRIAGIVRSIKNTFCNLPFVPCSPIPLVVDAESAVDGVLGHFTTLKRKLPALTSSIGLGMPTPGGGVAGASTAATNARLVTELAELRRDLRSLEFAANLRVDLDGRELARSYDRRKAYTDRASG